MYAVQGLTVTYHESEYQKERNIIFKYYYRNICKLTAKTYLNLNFKGKYGFF